jgi:phage FluMu protein Com
MSGKRVRCAGCGKIFSDTEAFCPKCGMPAELSGRKTAETKRTARNVHFTNASESSQTYENRKNISFGKIIAGIIAAIVILNMVCIIVQRNIQTNFFDSPADIWEWEYDDDYDDYYDEFFINSDGEEFIEKLSYAVTESYDNIQELDTSDMSESEQIYYMSRIFEREYQYLDMYENTDIGSDTVEWYRDAYFEGLRAQINGLDYTSETLSDYETLVEYGYSMKSLAIVNFDDYFDMPALSDEAEDMYEDYYDRSMSESDEDIIDF